jgi:hypothetical protein
MLTSCGPSRVEAEHLAIEGVREPRNRMPVRYVVRGEGPLNRAPRDAVLDMRICSYVLAVVKVDEGMAARGIVGCERADDQQKSE